MAGALIRVLTLQGVPPRLRVAAFCSAGVFVGLSGYVFHLSEAASYLSDDPTACINCHIMTPQYATWRHSSHARVTTCNDCHVPHDSAARKYWFKMKDGARHSFLFTFRMEPQVIRATRESHEVIQENCVRCHGDLVGNARTPIGHDFDRACMDCHREVPHGRPSSLSSTPNAAVPPVTPVVPGWFAGEGQKEGQ